MFNLGKPREFGPVEVQGKPLRCNVCGNGTFWEQEIQLPTPLFNLLDADEWTRLAQCAVCERCGFVHMFLSPPATTQENSSPPLGAGESSA